MKTLKSLALICLGALLFVGCDPDNNDGEQNGTKGLILKADKYEIYDNGEDCATFRLTFNGQPVTEGYTIYDENDNPIEGNTFSSTEIGYYEFWAEYGAAITKVNIGITVVATPPAAPAAPADKNPSKLNFHRRVMLLQFTGTGCQFCPYMVNALIELNEAKHYQTGEYLYKDKVILAAAHIGDFAGNDPAKMEEAKTIDDAFGITSYPSLVVDMHYGDIAPSYSDVSKVVDRAYNDVVAKGGIAANTEYHADKNYVMVNALVKAKETTEFRIGAMLLEDNITGTQSINANVPKKDGVNYNIHNNCIRKVKSQQPTDDFDFTGLTLGTIEAGKTKSQEFAFSLKNAWKSENLHVVIFISTKENGKWRINNIINAPINGSVDFEYAE